MVFGALSLPLEGKVALVTGAGRGQGRSHALALARAGADVVACDRSADLASVPYPLSTPDDLEETAAGVRAAGRHCLVAVADVRELASMEEVVAAAREELGGLDIVCANAGIISFAASWQLTEAQWDDVVGTNLKGAWVTCRAAIPAMLDQGPGGTIVLTTSAAGLRGYAGMSHYAASKHGVVGLARTLAIELAPHGIRVNCVAPGGVRTVMGESEAVRAHLAAHPDAARALTNLLPVDLVEPEDVSAALIWLCSDEARHVTGVVLPIDAGVQLR
jgi:SDR family mycofactocin-dependent oxidoreductase